MYKNSTFLAIIPARGGSKGIKNKNIIDINGKPLIWYTIKEAQKSNYIDNIFVSTDSKEISNIAKQYNIDIPFLRSRKNSSDNSKTIDAIIETIQNFEKINKIYDYIIILQPTSPLRTTEDIDNAIKKAVDNKCSSLISVCECEINPVHIRKIENGKLHRILDVCSTIRRQDMQKFYRTNGAIYINKTIEITEQTSFNDNVTPYIMSQENSIDIDDYEDLIKVREILKK